LIGGGGDASAAPNDGSTLLYNNDNNLQQISSVEVWHWSCGHVVERRCNEATETPRNNKLLATYVSWELKGRKIMHYYRLNYQWHLFQGVVPE
jgi:hypothetical protein